MAAADAGATAIGFNFYRESPRYISPTGAAMIAEKVPPEVWKVGVFVNEGPDIVARIALEVGLEVAQLHGTADAFGIRIWRACSVNDWELVESAVEALLLDTPSWTVYGGTGKTFDWSLAKAIPRKVVIAGGLDAENVRRAIDEAGPWGVDACSRLERSPGLKDHEKMQRFIKAALSS